MTPPDLSTSDLTIIEVVGLSLSAIGVFFSFLSIVFVYIIFVRTQKNYYKKYLSFMKKKRKVFLHYTKHYKVNENSVVDFLMQDLKFFAEDLLMNFSNDGTLEFAEYQMIKTMYHHIKKRFLITRKVTKKAINGGYKNIDIRIQLFGKYNTLNEKYFNNKLKNAKYKKENINVYTSLIFHYNHKTKTFDLKPSKKPIIYEMGDDVEFKKAIFYIFSSANKIELEEGDFEKQYFFIACSYSNKAQKIRGKKDESRLEQREKIQEARD